MHNRLLTALDYLIVVIAALGVALGCWGVIRLTSDHAADVWSYLMIGFGVLCLILLMGAWRPGPRARLSAGYRWRVASRSILPQGDYESRGTSEQRVKGMNTTLDND